MAKRESGTRSEYVTIKIPRTDKNQEDVEVSVNEKWWTIKRGVPVKVPVCVAEVLKNSEDMMNQAYEFENSVPNRV